MSHDLRATPLPQGRSTSHTNSSRIVRWQGTLLIGAAICVVLSLADFITDSRIFTESHTGAFAVRLAARLVASMVFVEALSWIHRTRTVTGYRHAAALGALLGIVALTPGTIMEWHDAPTMQLLAHQTLLFVLILGTSALLYALARRTQERIRGDGTG